MPQSGASGAGRASTATFQPFPNLRRVSTRKLIAIALLCGLAILIAGGIQLFRLSDTSERTVEVLAEGETATVGGIPSVTSP